jgi:hypothetical protein
MWHAPSYLKDRGQVFASVVTPPPTFYYGPDYADRSQPVANRSVSILGGVPFGPQAGIDLPATPYRTHYSYAVVVRYPGWVRTNVAAGPYIVRVQGATAVARTAAGTMVIAISGHPGQREVISFQTTQSATLRLGVALTLASIVGLLVLLAGMTVRSMRSGPRATQ